MTANALRVLYVNSPSRAHADLYIAKSFTDRPTKPDTLSCGRVRMTECRIHPGSNGDAPRSGSRTSTMRHRGSRYPAWKT